MPSPTTESFLTVSHVPDVFVPHPVPSATTRVVRLANAAACKSYIPAWNELAGGIPFRRWEWLGTWWKHYGTSRELYVLAVVDEQANVLGIAPWYLTTDSARTLRFLGDGKVCTDFLTILCRDEDRETVVRAIAEWLIATDSLSSPDAWRSIELEGVLKEDTAIDQLVAELRKHRLAVTERPAASCYAAQLPNSVTEYIQSRGKTNRRTMRRIQRDLESGSLSYRRVHGKDELTDEDWELFIGLHELRRATLREQGCFQHSPFGEFLREATTLLMPEGMSSIMYLYDRQTPMSALNMFHNDYTTFIYQTGMDPGVREKRPGYVSFAVALWWTIERGARVLDLMRGDEKYKEGWRAEPRAARNIRISSRHFSARVRHQLRNGQATLKDWLKGGLKGIPRP